MTELAHRLLRRFGYRIRKVDLHHRPGKEVEWFNRDPDNPYLVSFPRTGSHWLRLMIELYSGRPLLVRTFYYPDRNDYLLLHDHDMDLQVDRRSAIYLFRDPVDTVYSQLAYYGEAAENRLRIVHWTTRYVLHAAKWLIEQPDSSRITVLRYERLKDDLPGEFRKLTAHLGIPFDALKLRTCCQRVTTDEVKDRSGYEPSVMGRGPTYEMDRARFRTNQSELIWATIARISDMVYADESALAALFALPDEA